MAKMSIAQTLCLIKKMQKITSKYFIDFKKEILEHKLISGEIILFLYSHRKNKHQPKILIEELFELENIKIENRDLTLEKVSSDEMINSIKYGLSSKMNYTRIEVEFDTTKQNKYAFGFTALFENPTYYKTDNKIYIENLDLDDFWETGGGIIIDDKHIGIFLINDLYDKF